MEILLAFIRNVTESAGTRPETSPGAQLPQSVAARIARASAWSIMYSRSR